MKWDWEALLAGSALPHSAGLVNAHTLLKFLCCAPFKSGDGKFGCRAMGRKPTDLSGLTLTPFAGVVLGFIVGVSSAALFMSKVSTHSDIAL